MEIARLFGEQHPRLVQFPVVLLLTALIFDVAGLIWRSERSHWCGKLLMCAGTISLLAAFICGIFAEIWAGRAGIPHQEIKWHELVATAASWGFVALLAWRLFLDPNRRRALTTYVCVGLGFFILLGIAAYLGGQLVFEYGAAVRGARSNAVLTLHDLNTLAQRQTDENLRYSDWMHHTFGWLVLALCVTLLVRQLWPQRAPRLRWVGPGLLVKGGVFLLFFADLDLYALSNVRQLYDREVQMHKLLSLILISVGLYGILRLRRATETEKSEAQVHFQNRLVAALALVGGALLFTHVHTVAPYANVAAGVYINHVIMGIVALAIGAVKLWEPATRIGYRRKLLFPALLGLEAFLLITYTEGLPWYVGYGHYNRWGPNGGCIAPFGKFRAELVYNPDTSQMDVGLLDRFEDKPLSIGVSNVNVLISRGYQETVVPLNLTDAGSFRGKADFLKDATFFGATLTLPDGRTGYFDPWVIPSVRPVPPNEVARFSCPMHEGIRADTEGQCPLCGMPLAPIPNQMTTELHDAKFTMRLEYAGNTLRFVPAFAATGRTVSDLLVVHEHLLHLIIVSDDLESFDHVHPVRKDDGSFTIDYRFPRPGNFLLFADITPRGERSQVFRLPLHVRGDTPSQATPKQWLDRSREIGPYHVELISQPRKLTAQRPATFLFRLSRDGKPMIDLEPYIGAMGHCVIISQDAQLYLHSHPEQLTPIPSRGGPEVSFHTQFHKPGKYKIWGQFKRGSEIVVADFIVNVGKPFLPSWLVNALVFD
jgi:uncharacterized membrane protein